MFAPNEILDMAIQLERNGEALYRDAAGMASDPELATRLKWMADEEAKHADWFAEQKQKDESWDENSIAREMESHLLNSLMSRQSFSLGDADFCAITEINSLINVFIEFEKDTILFYEMLAPFLKNGKSRTRLQEIIAEENEHVDQLQGLLKD